MNFVMEGISVKKVGVREFQRKAPLILTKKDKPAFMVLPYEQFIKMQEELSPFQTPSVLNMKELELAPGQYVGIASSAFDTKPAKPSFWERLKAVLTKKVL